MKMLYGRVGERGQVVIPKALRERYHLEPHTRVEFIEIDGRLVLQPAASAAVADGWDAVRGILKGRVEDVDSDIEEMRGR
jgi:AbrB family looped-hinge helix DNA binding protein